jgi:hypothetical protein
MSIIQLVLTIIEIAEGDFYVREGNDYWQVSLTFPYMALDGVTVPIVGNSDEVTHSLRYSIAKATVMQQHEKLSKAKVSIV